MRRKKRLKDLVFTIILTSFWTIPAVSVLPQKIRPAVAHPNHYIVLIDASGSTTSSEVKRKTYEKALLGDLTSHLYRDGFGEWVPSYNPHEDFLTIHHFGIVTGLSGSAYTRLGEYDLLTQFIHPVFVRKQKVDEDLFKSILIPSQTYQYTILSWAKQLGLQNSGPANSRDRANRTFMILAHDGIPNQNSPAEELDMVRRWNNKGYNDGSALIGSIEKGYSFTNGRGANEWAWSDTVGEKPNSIFLEAYEIISSGQKKWEDEGMQIKPSDDLGFKWTSETGDAPEGILKFTLTDSFKAWINSAEEATVSVEAESEGKRVSATGTELPVSFNGPLSCSPRIFLAEIKVSMQRTDKLLGRTTLEYTYPETVTPPSPLGCTVGFYLSGGTILLVLGLIAALIAYYIYYRFYATHLEIEIPGTIVPIRIRRQSMKPVNVSVVPHREMEALSVSLPSIFIQQIFYRGASLTLRPENERVSWSEERDVHTVQLPLTRKCILAYWRELPVSHSLITLIFTHKGREAEISLSYPGRGIKQFEETSL